MTVQGARGYAASTFLYGTYGLQHVAWANKIRSCRAPQVLTAAEGVPMAGPPDEFEARARQVLGNQDPRLSELLALRTEAQRIVAMRAPDAAAMSAQELNQHNQRVLDQAAKLLGDQQFEEIFGFPPSEKIDLVDPTIKPGERNW